MRRFLVTVNGNRYEVEVEELNDGEKVAAAPQEPKAAPAEKAKKPAAGTPVSAPMPGNIVKVLVSAGAHVKSGDLLFILEAMKMENEIFAPQDGTVAEISVKPGDTVKTGEVLLTLQA